MSRITADDVIAQADEVFSFTNFVRTGNKYSDNLGNHFTIDMRQTGDEVGVEIGMSECMGMVGYLDQFETEREARNFFLYLATEIELKSSRLPILTKIRNYFMVMKPYGTCGDNLKARDDTP